MNKMAVWGIAIALGGAIAWGGYGYLRESGHEEAKRWNAAADTSVHIARVRENSLGMVVLDEPELLYFDLQDLAQLSPKPTKLQVKLEYETHFPPDNVELISGLKWLELHSRVPLENLRLDPSAHPQLYLFIEQLRVASIDSVYTLFGSGLSTLSIPKLYLGESQTSFALEIKRVEPNQTAIHLTTGSLDEATLQAVLQRFAPHIQTLEIGGYQSPKLPPLPVQMTALTSLNLYNSNHLEHIGWDFKRCKKLQKVRLSKLPNVPESEQKALQKP